MKNSYSLFISLLLPKLYTRKINKVHFEKSNENFLFLYFMNIKNEFYLL